ncbi:MAG: ComEC/Rec2 family competence protein [Treponema sp.]|jgi:competence protein ComEC|nr:ComEC/Rec2 family competence protein [Treponema sp.]
MVNGIRITPVLCAAFCAAVSYYTAPYLSPAAAFQSILALLGGTVCLTGFLRALLSGQAFLFRVQGGEDKKAVMRRKTGDRIRTAHIYVIAAALGFFAGFAAGRPFPIHTGLPPANITGIYGVMRDDPRILTNERGTRGMGSVAIRRAIGGAGKTEASASGTVSVFFPESAIPRLKEFGRGSEVYLEGDFLIHGKGKNTAEENSAEAEVSLFRAHSVHIVQPAPDIEQFRTGIRLTIAERFSQYRWGGLALALLFGIKDTLDSTLAKRYQAAGCSHVLALSGMHLAVVSAVIAFLLKKPLGLKAAALAGAVFITAYVYLVGAMPSLNRAAIMYLLGAITLFFSLPKDTLSLLGMAFLLQIGVQPAAGYSLSFILSYLALAGILALSGPVYTVFRGRLPDFLGQSLAASIAAFLATAGVSAAFFGVIKPFGIIAGLVIVPLTTVFMIGSLAALALVFIAPSAPAWFDTALSLFYQGLESAASWAAIPPGIKIDRPVPVLLASFAIIALVLGAHYMRTRCARMKLCLRRAAAGERIAGERFG